MIIRSYAEKPNIGDAIYNNIKQKILDWEFSPGQQLSEQKISSELGVSRTPVREAFIKLIGEDLLEARPYIGTFVAYIQLKHVEEARFVREVLEKAVTLLACDLNLKNYILESRRKIKEQESALKAGNLQAFIRLDNEMHHELFVACGKERTWQVVEAMNSQYNRLRFLSLACSEDVRHLILEHTGMIDAIERKDKKQAEALTGEHLHHLTTEITSIRDRHPEYFKD